MNTENALTKEVFESHKALIETLCEITGLIDILACVNYTTVTFQMSLIVSINISYDSIIPEATSMYFPVEQKIKQKFEEFEKRYVQ